MEMIRRVRFRVSWIALIAFLFATFAPTVSAAFPHKSTTLAVWGQLCTVDGQQAVRIDTGDSDENPAAAHHGSTSQAGHCLLCFYPATLPPSELPAVTGFTRAVVLLPRLFLRTPRPLFIWAASQPRGPPAQA